MWTLHRQQQQCGAQVRRPRQPGEAPAEAVRDRAAQDHEQAGETLQPGEYPASPLEDRDGDHAAPASRIQWDEVVQPERQQQAGETELEQDERGEDAEPIPDAQAEQALRDGDDDEAGSLDRND